MDIGLLIYKLYQQCENKEEAEDLFQEIEDLNNMDYENRCGELECDNS